MDIKIGNRIIGPGRPVYIIAEIGSNHDGNKDQALELIRETAKAGADAVKFQFFKAESLYRYNDDRYKITKKFETPREWLPELIEEAKIHNIHFSASPFDVEAIDLLVKNNVPFLKIGSPEIRDYQLLTHSASSNTPIILSTGVTNITDVAYAVDIIEKNNFSDLVILQCTSIYPTEPKYVNLNVIKTFQEIFPYPIGLSDHSMSSTIPAAAVALGACVIEKHVTLDQNGPSPDSSISITIKNFSKMVVAIREIEIALGSSYKSIIDGKESYIAHEKSLVAKKDIELGEILNENNLIAKRASGGISSLLAKEVYGYKINKPLPKDSLLSFDILSSK